MAIFVPIASNGSITASFSSCGNGYAPNLFGALASIERVSRTFSGTLGLVLFLGWLMGFLRFGYVGYGITVLARLGGAAPCLSDLVLHESGKTSNGIQFFQRRKACV